MAVRASGAGHEGGTLSVLGPKGIVMHPDATRVRSPETAQLAALTNDGLVGFRRVGGSAGTRLVPDLAVSLPTPTDDGRTYRFQLRPGIRYSTGALVRPQDFRRAIVRWLVLPHTGRYYSNIVGAQKCLARTQPCDLSRGIETDLRSNTVVFHLEAPDPEFLAKLTLPAAFAVPEATPIHATRPLPATGPYMLASTPTTTVRLIRNPRFHEWSRVAQPRGFPDRIVVRFEGSPDSHVTAVLRGSADLATDTVEDFTGRARKRADAACEPARAQSGRHHQHARPEHAGSAVR